MSDAVLQAIGQANSGYVEAPAGCGKTEAIVNAVARHAEGRQLVLTHTHAGVDALRQRFRHNKVASAKYHVDTIAGWAWGWVRRFPRVSGYRPSTDIAEWAHVYPAMHKLLGLGFVRAGIRNSYAGVIVDEYQDCTVPMHAMIVEFAKLLPCRVLGDELQGIFDFNEPLVDWTEVRKDFKNDLGSLDQPHRWIKAGNKPLGDWLLGTRSSIRALQEPAFSPSPLIHRAVPASELGRQLISLVHELEGRVCVIGPKSRPIAKNIETSLVRHSFRVVEPNELSVLQGLVRALDQSAPKARTAGLIKFIERVFGGLATDDKNFLENLAKGKGAKPRRADRKVLWDRHKEGVTALLIQDVLDYAESCPDVSCKLRDSVSALKCVLEIHLSTGAEIKSLYSDEVARRKYQSRSRIYRCIGSTLLLKGLEFDHAIVLRGPNWQQSWGGHKDLYVALTRGSRSVTLLDVTGA